MVSPSLCLTITEVSQVGDARRQAQTLALRLGFDETSRGKLSLIVTEAANNLIQHGGGGDILLRKVEQSGIVGLELLALDGGPGMANVGKCLQDGYSTAGTPGTGLGAISRLATTFDIYSQVGAGTALLARLWQSGTMLPPASGLDIGAVCVAYAGEQECGDSWACHIQTGSLLLLLADGLGHGASAAHASQEAVRIFLAQTASGKSFGPQPLLEAIHTALLSTRGAAAAIAAYHPTRNEVVYAGVGNIAGTIVVGTESRSLISHNGTVGHQVRKVQEFVYPCPPGALLILHSDGLSAHWRLDRYPGLALRDPALIAGVLYRDFQRSRDDSCIVVVRPGRTTSAA